MLKKLGGRFVDSNSEAEYFEIDSSKYLLITELSDWEAAKEKLNKSEIIALDTETNSLDFLSAKLVGVSLSDKETTLYVPLNHEIHDGTKQLETDFFYFAPCKPKRLS